MTANILLAFKTPPPHRRGAMISKLWAVPLLAAGFVATGIVLAIGWTCPTGGTAYCSHAYFAGGWLAVLGAGGLLILAGIVLIAAGGRRFPK